MIHRILSVQFTCLTVFSTISLQQDIENEYFHDSHVNIWIDVTSNYVIDLIYVTKRPTGRTVSLKHDGTDRTANTERTAIIGTDEGMGHSI